MVVPKCPATISVGGKCVFYPVYPSQYCKACILKEAVDLVN